MNYRHAFHAGNFGDCMKHALLIRLMRAMQRKPAPVFVLDTHAGAGSYDLSGGPAERTGEWRAGIGRLLHGSPPPTAEYVDLVRSLGLYPGSPRLLRALLRADDRIACCELHPEDHAELRRLFARDPQVAVHHRNAWEALGALLPPIQRRALVLIDPPFEAPDEFAQLVAGITRAHDRMGHAVIAAWYPIKHRSPVRDLHHALHASGMRDIVAAEFLRREATDPTRLNGCGLAVVNPPFGFGVEATTILSALLERLARERRAKAWRYCASPMSSSVAVIGAGAWGTALAIQAVRAGSTVTLWARDPQAVRSRPRLPGCLLPEVIAITGRLPEEAFDVVLVAVPVPHLRAVLRHWHPAGPVVLCAKGLEAGTGLLPSEILAALYPDTAAAVLSGPNFAGEVAAGLPAAAALASADAELRATTIELLGTPAFRLYSNDDPLGVQLCGAAKNVMAIGAGAVIGGGLGENARAALVTRGVRELARLVESQGGSAQTAYGLSGLGDLLLTCTGPTSRNYSLGLALGRGARLDDILAGRSVATEGVATAPALLLRAAGEDLPICAAVGALLAGETSVPEAMHALLGRRLRDE